MAAQTARDRSGHRGPGGAPPLQVENLDQARFCCVYPRCGGVCCRQGRPAVEPAEIRRIDALLPRLLPLLRAEARAELRQGGWLSQRIKQGRRCVRVVERWCLFFNQGCVLHRLGLEDGAAYRYKPWRCVTFPLNFERGEGWYVRQHGHRDEAWDLFCLDPAASEAAARDSLQGELAFAGSLREGAELWRRADVPPLTRR